MFFSISLVGITTALITSVGHLYIVYAISFIGGHGAGALETGGNVLILDVWRGHDSGPPLHMVHFGYAIGTVIGPLMAAPFLKEVASILE
jgi:FHS family Na+ dependent glucose MFS transporter 1